MQDNSLASANGSLLFSQASWAVNEGDVLTVEVQRINGSVGAASVRVVAHFLSASADDASLSASTLSWEDGDSESQILEINLSADALEEDDELLVLRLESPTGGASLLQPNLAYVRISDVGSASTLSPLDDEVIVSHSRSTVLLSVQRQGDVQNSASVDWTLDLPEGLGFTQTSGTLEWAAGDTAGKTVELSYSSKPDTEVDFALKLSNPLNASLNGDTVNVHKQAVPPNVTPPTPGGGNSVNGQSGGGSATLLLLLLLMSGITSRVREPLRVSLDRK